MPCRAEKVGEGSLERAGEGRVLGLGLRGGRGGLA